MHEYVFGRTCPVNSTRSERGPMGWHAPPELPPSSPIASFPYLFPFCLSFFSSFFFSFPFLFLSCPFCPFPSSFPCSYLVLPFLSFSSRSFSFACLPFPSFPFISFLFFPSLSFLSFSFLPFFFPSFVFAFFLPYCLLFLYNFTVFLLYDIDVSANVIKWLLPRTWMQVGATFPGASPTYLWSRSNFNKCLYGDCSAVCQPQGISAFKLEAPWEGFLP